MKTAIFVLGMHRGGTSAVARVLGFLGAHLPRNLMPPMDGINPRGFWESVDVADANDRFLEAVGLSWDDPSALASAAFTSAAAEELRTRARALLSRDLESPGALVIKDPRMSRLLPVWLEAARDEAMESRVVSVSRHPLEVSASLARRDGFSRQKSLRLWLRHLLDAERHSRGLPRLWVTFAQTLNDWRCLQAASSWMGSGGEIDLAAVGAQVDGFLTPELRHHQRDLEDLATGIPPWIRIGFELALAMVEAPSPELEARFDRLRDDLDGVEGLFEAVGAGGANASTVEALERLQHQLEADRLGTSSWRRELDRVNESQLQSLQDGLEGGRSRGRLVTDSARTVENLAAELAATRSELEGLRAELEQLRVSGNQMQQALQARSLQVEARLFERERLYRELRDKTVNLEKTRQALAESRERHRHWVRDLLSTMAEPDGVE